MSEYFVSINGQSYGPATPETLGQWAKAGSFGPADFVWDGAEWVAPSRVAELAGIFAEPPRSALGVENEDELPPHESASVAAAIEPAHGKCLNHEERFAAARCPRCGENFCAQCMTLLDGLDVCLDCVSAERGRGAGFLKRFAPALTALAAVFLLMFVSYLFFAHEPPAQPDELEEMKLMRSDGITSRTSGGPAVDEPVITEISSPDKKAN